MAIEDRNLEPGTQLIAKYKKEEYNLYCPTKAPTGPIGPRVTLRGG